MWASTVDLKDASLYVPIHPTHQRFLEFNYRGVDSKFVALPFGLSSSPGVFTRVAGAALKDLRRRGIPLSVYLDDCFVPGESYQDTADNTALSVNLLIHLGCIINMEISNLIPSQEVKYLGAHLDFTEGTICMAQVWLRLLGLMTSLVDIIPFYRLRMRPIQVDLLRFYRLDLEKQVPMSQLEPQHQL